MNQDTDHLISRPFLLLKVKGPDMPAKSTQNPPLTCCSYLTKPATDLLLLPYKGKMLETAYLLLVGQLAAGGSKLKQCITD
jgi:hypothetical protein